MANKDGDGPALWSQLGGENKLNWQQRLTSLTEQDMLERQSKRFRDKLGRLKANIQVKTGEIKKGNRRNKVTGWEIKNLMWMKEILIKQDRACPGKCFY